MILFALRMLGFARQALHSALAMIRTYPLQAALIGAVALAGWQWHGKRNALAERDQAIVALATQAKAYRTAQEVAAIEAQAAKDAVEHAYQEKAREADMQYTAALAGARDRAGAYADAHSVRRCVAGASGQAAPAPGDSPAPDNDGPGADAGMVAIPRKEFDDLTANTIRLDTIVNVYAKSLIDGGYAIKALPEPAFPAQ